ncbi:MAG: hypothetical protein HC828_07545 [Blastochloris sp.]|nr:hypothetical protein [Blastochloris sp.]
MSLTIDLTDDLAEFARQMAEALEYPSVDALIAAMLIRQRDAVQTGASAQAGTPWTANLHKAWRQRIEDARRQSSVAV